MPPPWGEGALSSFVSLNTSRNHQHTLWVPGTNYFDHAFVTQDNSAPQGLHPECHDEGAKRGNSSKNNWSKTSFGLFRKPLILKERPWRGAQPKHRVGSSHCDSGHLKSREIRCSTPSAAPTSATGTTKHQTHPAPISPVTDGAPLYLRRHRSISRCAEISPR